MGAVDVRLSSPLEQGQYEHDVQNDIEILTISGVIAKELYKISNRSFKNL
jgi:hypothetical protein